MMSSLPNKKGQFKNCSVHTRPSSKMAPLPQGAHRKSMKLMCEILYLHCIKITKAVNEDSRQLTYLLPLAYSKASAFTVEFVELWTQ